MKINLHLTLIFLFLFSKSFAQAPQSVNYQAIIRNDVGVVVPNKTINIRFSIQEGIATTPQYIEVHQAITNSVGLVTLAIGKGTAQTGTFAGINWSLGTKYLKIEVDINGGNNFALIGTQQFLSVPYALYAERAGNSAAPGWGLNSNALTGTESLGSTNNQPLLFRTNNIERARITEGGRIGLGTTNPTQILDIQVNEDGLGSNDGRFFLKLNNTSTSSASQGGLQMLAGGSSNVTTLSHVSPSYSIFSGYSDFGQLRTTGPGLVFQAANGILRFEAGLNGNNAVERMRITNDGKMGLGISSPTAQFHTTSSVRFAGLTQNNQLNQIVSMDAQGNLAWRDASTLIGSGNNSGWGLTGNSLTGTESIGSTNNQPLIFKTNNTEKVRITEAGRIGLGSISPKGWLTLEAKGDGLSTIEDRIFLYVNNTSTSSSSQAVAHFTAGGSSNLLSISHVSPSYSIIPGYADYSQLASTGPGLILQARNGILRFETGISASGNVPSERMRIANDGKIGIGTSNPSQKLDIQVNEDGLGAIEGRFFLKLNNTSTSSASQGGLQITAGGSSNVTTLSHVSPTYSVFSGYSDFGQLRSTGSGIILQASGANGLIKFQTNGTTERLRISSSGNVGIGTTNPTAKLEVANGDVYVNDATKGIILKSPNGNCWRVTVDDSGNFVRTAISCPN